MPETTRGLHVTQYREDCFSMSSIIIKFTDTELNEGEGSIADNVFHAIGRLLYIYIRKSEYIKEGEFSNYMENKQFAEVSFCLTPACGEKEILRFVQNLFLDLLGLNLRTNAIIEAVGAENIPKMEEELAEAKVVVKDLLLDITMNGKVSFETEWC